MTSYKTAVNEMPGDKKAVHEMTLDEMTLIKMTIAII
jgi:hypothetical protein